MPSTWNLTRNATTGAESRHIELGATAIGTEGKIGDTARLSIIHNGEVAAMDDLPEYAAVCAANALAEMVADRPDEVAEMSANDLLSVAHEKAAAVAA